VESENCVLKLIRFVLLKLFRFPIVVILQFKHLVHVGQLPLIVASRYVPPGAGLLDPTMAPAGCPLPRPHVLLQQLSLCTFMTSIWTSTNFQVQVGPRPAEIFEVVWASLGPDAMLLALALLASI
jgi:hypothetical protein